MPSGIVLTLFIGIDQSLGDLLTFFGNSGTWVSILCSPDSGRHLRPCQRPHGYIIKCSSIALPGTGTVLLLILQTLKFSFSTNVSSPACLLFSCSYRTSLTSLTLPSPFSCLPWLSVLSCLDGLPHSITRFPPTFNSVGHLILIPTSILSSLMSLLLPCTCPANPQTEMDFSICFLLSHSQAAE